MAGRAMKRAGCTSSAGPLPRVLRTRGFRPSSDTPVRDSRARSLDSAGLSPLGPTGMPESHSPPGRRQTGHHGQRQPPTWNPSLIGPPEEIIPLPRTRQARSSLRRRIPAGGCRRRTRDPPRRNLRRGSREVSPLPDRTGPEAVAMARPRLRAPTRGIDRRRPSARRRPRPRRRGARSRGGRSSPRPGESD